jgi:hypothetical protein
LEPHISRLIESISDLDYWFEPLSESGIALKSALSHTFAKKQQDQRSYPMRTTWFLATNFKIVKVFPLLRRLWKGRPRAVSPRVVIFLVCQSKAAPRRTQFINA